jgi:hypothetical protein
MIYGGGDVYFRSKRSSKESFSPFHNIYFSEGNMFAHFGYPDNIIIEICSFTLIEVNYNNGRLNHKNRKLFSVSVFHVARRE